ncbi:hypothetical protein B0H34DRAFT_679302 [Crassisporium funariophilum]|nr:hypothetical protein B0H34DRAFT_679302 [Crassisporium funariophilum]
MDLHLPRPTLIRPHPLARTPNTPLTTPTSLLIRTSHAALNPGGTIVISLFPTFLAHSSPAPWVPELDFSGTIVKLGADVSAARPELAVGQDVFGVVPMGAHLKTGAGALGEYVVVEMHLVALKPKNATMAESAGLGVAACTALVLVRRAGLREGDKVLVNGGTGGAGSFAVQLARKAVGKSGTVVVVCSTGNDDLVKSLGADEAIDYKAHNPLHTYLTTHHSASPFKSIIDAVGITPLFLHSASYLAPGSTYVSIGVKLPSLSYGGMFWSVAGMMRCMLLPAVLGGGGRAYAQVSMMEPAVADLEQLRGMVEEGSVRCVVDSVWEMEDALKAYEKWANGKVRGKVVVHVGSDE